MFEWPTDRYPPKFFGSKRFSLGDLSENGQAVSESAVLAILQPLLMP